MSRTPRTVLAQALVLAPTLALVLVGAAPAPACPDTILKTDGTKIEDVEVQSETLTEVTYAEGRDQRTVPSEEVLEVTFSRAPTLVDEAIAFLLEGDLIAAVDNLDVYVDDEIEKPSERRYRWAPAYAAWKATRVRSEMADMKGMQAAAKRLIDAYPGSRYVLLAYLDKASAEAQMGDAAAAGATLVKLAELVEEKGLSTRWKLEGRLAQTRYDEAMDEAARRNELAVIAREASAYPNVASEARVAEGETYLAEAEGSDAAAAKALREKAQGVFDAIVADPKATEAAWAGAYSGLGDCLFHQGAEAEDTELLKKAALHYLRVATLHRSESRYAPRALFYAMRCFDLMQDRRRQGEMKRELVAQYPGSAWARQAEKF